MTTPKLTGWIKGKPLKSRPGLYEVAVQLNSGRMLYGVTRWRWFGNQWEYGTFMRWTHFRGLAKKA
jgi:hypothetical protein